VLISALEDKLLDKRVCAIILDLQEHNVIDLTESALAITKIELVDVAQRSNESPKLKSDTTDNRDPTLVCSPPNARIDKPLNTSVESATLIVNEVFPFDLSEFEEPSTVKFKIEIFA
jgi:hypothetical protein